MTLISRDPNSTVQGIAIPVLAATLEAVKKATPGDPVVRAVVDLLSADVIGKAEPTCAADMLVVAEQLDAGIGALRR
jgi:hypothetical protein